jgi:hypothetical protein
MAADKPTNSQVKAASNRMGDAQKFPTANGDVGSKMFDDYGALASVIDEKAERRFVRKLDMFIIPLFGATYHITYIDKATLSFGTQPLFHAPNYTDKFKLLSSVSQTISSWWEHSTAGLV